MKKLLISGMFSLACFSFISQDTFAQNRISKSKTERVQNADETKDAKHVKFSNTLIEKLNLNKKQAKQVRGINANTAQEMKTIRNSKMPQDLKREKMKALKAKAYEDLSNVMNRTQKAEFEKLHNERMENRKDARTNKARNGNAQKKGRVDSIRKGNANSSVNRGNKGVRGENTGVRGNSSGQRGGNMNPEAFATSRTNRMKSNLGLSDRQYEAIYNINLDAANRLKTLRESARDISRQEYLTQKGMIENDTKNETRAILNPEQQEKFNAYIEKREGRKMDKNNNNGRSRGNQMTPHRPR